MTMQTSPSLLVVILNFRTAAMTLRAVEAALADMPRGAELIIVDNASSDGSVEVLQQAIADQGWGPQVRLVASAVNGGFGAGNNIGIRAGLSDGSEADFVFVVNSDAFVDRGCIEHLMAHMADHPRAGLAGSHVRGSDGLPHTTAFRFPSVAGEFEGAARIGVISRALSHAIVAPDLPETSTRVDWVAGASVLLRGSMLRDIGLFDETFFLYFEETDLCKRAAVAGWECWYVPQARAVHIGSVSTGMKEWQRMPEYWFNSRQHYFTKNHGVLYAKLAWAARLAGGAVHKLRCVLSGRPPQDPPHFLGDLMRHGLGLARNGSPRMSRRTITEDTL